MAPAKTGGQRKMMGWGRWAGAIFLALEFFGGAKAQQKTVNVYNWTDYVGPNVIPGFEKETGIKVNYDTYDQNETLEAKLSAGNSGYDVAVPTFTPFLVRGAKNGLYQPLNKALLKNWGNLDPEILALMARSDPGNHYAVPWIVATDGIAVNVEKVKAIMAGAPLDSYDLMFKPEILARFKDCGVEMIDSPTDEMPGDPQLAQARSQFGKAGGSRARGGGHELDPAPLSASSNPRDISTISPMATSASPSVIRPTSRSPRSGRRKRTSLSTSSMSSRRKEPCSISTRSPFPPARPMSRRPTLSSTMSCAAEVMADTANLVGGRSGNAASLPDVKPEIANDPTIYPPPEVQKNLVRPDRAEPPVRQAAHPAVDEDQDRPVMIRVEGLTKNFGGEVAVDRVDLSIARSEFFAILGGSGSGKTTLLRMIAGFTVRTGAHPDRGRRHDRRAAARAPGQHDVPVLRAVSPHERGEERRIRLAPGGLSRRASCGKRSGRGARHGAAMRALRRSASRTSFRAASDSASLWRGRSSTGRRCCCSTSRCPRSTSKLREQTQFELMNMQKKTGRHFRRSSPTIRTRRWRWPRGSR